MSYILHIQELDADAGIEYNIEKYTISDSLDKIYTGILGKSIKDWSGLELSDTKSTISNLLNKLDDGSEAYNLMEEFEGMVATYPKYYWLVK